MNITAIQTNAISNAVHALFLLFYFLGALIHYLKKDHKFSQMNVLFFLALFIIKIIGIYVHIANTNITLPPGWIAISLLVIMMNYFLIYSIAMPDITRSFCMLLSVASSFLFLTHDASFIFIAFPSIAVYLIVAYYSKLFLRTGMIMVVISNILWICMRQITNYIAGHKIAIEFRFDNDIYHLCLIVSTFIIYKAFLNQKIPLKSN